MTVERKLPKMIDEKSPKDYNSTGKFNQRIIGIGIIALSGLIGRVGYEMGKMEGQAELYRAAAYHMVDTNKNDVLEDTELALLAREIPKYDYQSARDYSTKILTRDEMQNVVDNASNYAWERFVDERKGFLSKL